MQNTEHNIQTTHIDQMGRHLSVPAFPKRIVSLVPSQTELIYDLGAGSRLVGITKYCIHPKKLVRKVPKIGGTKNIDLNKIQSLAPDLIIGNKEENTKEDIIALEKKYPVWLSDIYTLADSLDMIQKIGKLLQTPAQASQICQQINTRFELLVALRHKTHKPKALYLIWKEPYMGVGAKTFIHDVLQYAGLNNTLANAERYPELTTKEIQNIAPDIVLLSSEPYPFKARHIEEFKQLLPQADVRIIDGEMFSWYGSRLLQTALYLHQNFGDT